MHGLIELKLGLLLHSPFVSCFSSFITNKGSFRYGNF